MKARIMPFDTLRFANRMKAAGMATKLAEEQAEAIAEALYDGLQAKLDNLVTKDLLKAETSELKTEMANLRTDMATLKLGLELKIENIEKRLGRLIIACFSLTAVVLGIIKYFHF